MEGNIVSLKQFINGIRESKSSDPQALTLRPGSAVPDWIDQRDVRKTNTSNYRRLRKIYSSELFGTREDLAGLYFICSSHKDNPFYYIGISKGLIGRVDKHLLTKDYYFFMLAFPHNKIQYYNEAKKLYFEDGQNYDEKYNEFERQYKALEKTIGMNSIAWVSNPLYSSEDWERIESFFVTTYQPPGNKDKMKHLLQLPPFSNYKSKYDEVRNYLFEVLIPRISIHK